jgi:hypothetical protein
MSKSFIVIVLLVHQYSFLHPSLTFAIAKDDASDVDIHKRHDHLVTRQGNRHHDDQSDDDAGGKGYDGEKLRRRSRRPPEKDEEEDVVERNKVTRSKRAKRGKKKVKKKKDTNVSTGIDEKNGDKGGGDDDDDDAGGSVPQTPATVSSLRIPDPKPAPSQTLEKEKDEVTTNIVKEETFASPLVRIQTRTPIAKPAAETFAHGPIRNPIPDLNSPSETGRPSISVPPPPKQDNPNSDPRPGPSPTPKKEKDKVSEEEAPAPRPIPNPNPDLKPAAKPISLPPPPKQNTVSTGGGGGGGGGASVSASDPEPVIRRPTRRPTGKPGGGTDDTDEPTRRPTGKPTRRPTGKPTRKPTRKTTIIDDEDTSSPTGMLIEGPGGPNPISRQKTLDLLSAIAGTINNNLFVTEVGQPSTIYKVEDLVKGLKLMNEQGVAGMHFYLGNDENAYRYGLTNVAAFLAQSMKETIKYDACSESEWHSHAFAPCMFDGIEFNPYRSSFLSADNWDLYGSGGYPLSNACGQLKQSYQDYKCPVGQEHMECKVDPNMAITAVTHAKWYGGELALLVRIKRNVSVLFIPPVNHEAFFLNIRGSTRSILLQA